MVGIHHSLFNHWPVEEHLGLLPLWGCYEYCCWEHLCAGFCVNLSFHFSGIWPFPEEILNIFKPLQTYNFIDSTNIYWAPTMCRSCSRCWGQSSKRGWQRPLPSQVTQNWIIVQTTWNEVHSTAVHTEMDRILWLMIKLAHAPMS